MSRGWDRLKPALGLTGSHRTEAATNLLGFHPLQDGGEIPRAVAVILMI